VNKKSRGLGRLGDPGKRRGRNGSSYPVLLRNDKKRLSLGGELRRSNMWDWGGRPKNTRSQGGGGGTVGERSGQIKAGVGGQGWGRIITLTAEGGTENKRGDSPNKRRGGMASPIK